MLGACLPALEVPPARVAAPAPPRAAEKVRWFVSPPDDPFWVTRGGDTELVVAGGGRFEVRRSGELVAAGWDVEATTQGTLLGALALPSRLGGGFIVWSHERVFHGAEFTGPLDPIPLELGVDVGVRGARAGLGSVLVFTDAGPREVEIGKGAPRVRPTTRPALLDVATLGERRAVFLDVFRRASLTDDGGATLRDLTREIGFVRELAVGRDQVFLDGMQGRFVVHGAGPPERRDASKREALSYSFGSFQTAWEPPLLPEESPGLTALTALSVAAATGATVGDGTALGVIGNAVVRVDLRAPRLLFAVDDWLPPGVSCQPMRAPDGVLFACAWDRSMGYGAYVLRSTDGGLPTLERGFTDDGSFVADDDGAIAFVGSCSDAPRVVNKNDPSRLEGDVELGPVVCVRGGPDRWEEHRIDVPEGWTVAGWAPRLDGTAAALLLSTDPLPPASGSPRRFEQGGVSVVRVFPEQSGYTWKRVAPQSISSIAIVLDKRYRAQADGSIDGWLLSPDSSVVPVGVTLDRAGYPSVYDAAPKAAEVAFGGSFGLALGRDQELYETVDHGKTWRDAGTYSLPSSAGSWGLCSAVGCAVGPLVRLGWGPNPGPPRVPPVSPVSPGAPPTGSAPRLACSPVGLPMPTAAPAHPGAEGHSLFDSMSAELEAGKPRGRVRARALFDAGGVTRSIESVDGRFDAVARAMPLLSRSGEVDLLFASDAGELLTGARGGAAFSAFDDARRATHRAGFGPTGVSLPDGSALVLASVRQGFTLEEHGPHSKTPPIFLGDTPAGLARPLALAWRDDGAIGVLASDGGVLGAAGAAVVDRRAGAVGPTFPLAAWSTVTTAEDPRCHEADPGAWRALLYVDPRSWFALDERSLGGVRFGPEGLLQVRWGASRVCLEAIDALVVDDRRDGRDAATSLLTGRWDQRRAAPQLTLRSPSLRQALTCARAPAP